MSLEIHRIGAILFALVLFALIYARYSPAQECCPVSELIASWDKSRVTQPLMLTPPSPYLYGTAAPIIGRYPIYPYNPVHRGRLYTFTGTILNGVPIYRVAP